MLARLDQEFAPLHSSVDREGNLLRLQGQGNAPELARVTKLLEEMGYFAEKLEAFVNVEKWFGAAETDELSQEEALVLAQGWADELAADGVIADPLGLVEPLRLALLDTFRATARTGAIHMPRIDDATLRAVLGEAGARDVRRWIERKLIRLDPE